MDSQRLARALGITVGAWGAANLAGGVALAVAGRGPGASAFGQQSAAWGAINLAIAGVGAMRARHKPVDLHRLRTILLVNAALDVGYMAVGAAIVRTSARPPAIAAAGAPEVPDEAIHPQHHAGREAKLGHGAAVVVQGAALGLIDTAFALAATATIRQAGDDTR